MAEPLEYPYLHSAVSDGVTWHARLVLRADTTSELRCTHSHPTDSDAEFCAQTMAERHNPLATAPQGWLVWAGEPLAVSSAPVSSAFDPRQPWSQHNRQRRRNPPPVTTGGLQAHYIIVSEQGDGELPTGYQGILVAGHGVAWYCPHTASAAHRMPQAAVTCAQDELERRAAPGRTSVLVTGARKGDDGIAEVGAIWGPGRLLWTCDHAHGLTALASHCAETELERRRREFAVTFTAHKQPGSMLYTGRLGLAAGGSPASCGHLHADALNALHCAETQRDEQISKDLPGDTEPAPSPAGSKEMAAADDTDAEQLRVQLADVRRYNELLLGDLEKEIGRANRAEREVSRLRRLLEEQNDNASE